ncbi:hypothetical protein [Caulobacter vibrioides]|uniref:hypothetical protein n=1 Tax=Caulobacter vibrioides TaxID=155892 RepID=UPI000F73B889|nr:hypothetical protein [Caulobacter vibrioides]
MPDFPAAPCFVHTPGTHEFWLKEAPLDQELTNPFALSNGWSENNIVFDAEGAAWRMIVPGASRYRKWYWRLLSHLYSPTFPIEISWKPLRPYRLSELLAVFKEQVTIDDDLLTQFYEVEEIYHLLDGCRNFDDVLSVWHKVERGPD